MAKRNAIIGSALLALSFIVGLTALSYGYSAEYGPGPGFIPFWLSVILGLLSTVLIIQGILEIRKKPDEKIAEDLKMLSHPKIFFSALGTIFLVAGIIEVLGFVITVAISTTVFVRLVKPGHKMANSLFIGLATSAVMYGFFKYVMEIALPKGVLPL